MVLLPVAEKGCERRAEEAKQRRSKLDADEEDLAVRQDAMIEAEEAHASQRSLLQLLESKTLGREAKATQKERDLVLRERAFADIQSCALHSE